MYGYVYKIIINDKDSSINGHYYIGQHKCKIDNEIDVNYWGSGTVMRNYIAKHGTTNLTREILEWAESLSDLNNLEKEYVDMSLRDPLCINIVCGGYVPTTHRWYTDGKNDICAISSPNDNWKSGSRSNVNMEKAREIISMKAKGTKTYNNGEREIRCKGNPPEGYVPGRLQSCTVFTEKHRQKMRNIMSSGYHWYNNGIDQIYTKDDPPEGYTHGMLIPEEDRQKNSEIRTGSRYYNNGIKTIVILNDEIPPDGYVPGILFTNEGRKNMAKCKGKKWYNNGKEQNLFNEGEQPDGWIKGMLPVKDETKKKLSKSSKGKIWYNNGSKSIMCYEGKQPEGFIKGRLVYKK